METINIEKLVSMYNDENKGLEEIGKEIGKSKSTVQKMFSKNGYKLNKSIGKYENNISIETIILFNIEFHFYFGKLFIKAKRLAFPFSHLVMILTRQVRGRGSIPLLGSFFIL